MQDKLICYNSHNINLEVETIEMITNAAYEINKIRRKTLLEVEIFNELRMISILCML